MGNIPFLVRPFHVWDTFCINREDLEQFTWKCFLEKVVMDVT